mgnify:CR=1 FL=1
MASEIPVVFATDENYVPYCGVAICSLIRNIDPCMMYKIYVLYDSLSFENITKLERLSVEHASVKCICIHEYVKDIKVSDYMHITVATIFRIVIPEIFKKYEKVIYLDSDIIVRKDISFLYQTELDDSYLAACKHEIRGSLPDYLKNVLNVDEDVYFNAGVLVINIKKCVDDNIYNEFDGFEKFFEVMDKFDWEKSVISLFGIFSSIDYQKKLNNYNSSVTHFNNKKGSKNNNNINNNINEPFWYLTYKKGKENGIGNNVYTMNRIDINKEEDECDNNEPLLKLSEMKKLISPINKSMGEIYLKREGRIINTTNFDKLINILDPLNNHNNLGKSISFHSKSKMKKIISHMNKQFK